MSRLPVVSAALVPEPPYKLIAHTLCSCDVVRGEVTTESLIILTKDPKLFLSAARIFFKKRTQFFFLR